MGLYLCIFDGEDEVDGLEIGSYDDFKAFRECVVKVLESGNPGFRFPRLILHSDSDGEWTPEEAHKLEKELLSISEGLRLLSPKAIEPGWQQEVAMSGGLRFNNLYDCFFDIDGHPLIERMVGFARLSQQRALHILFQ